MMIGTVSITDLHPDPHGFASLWEPGSGSTSNKYQDPHKREMQIQIRINRFVLRN
jgi:hypothetical protein